MEKVNITWLPKFNRSISQVYSKGLEYALVNNALQQCHDFIFCKDFIQDAVQGYLHNRKAQIFGFWYDPKTQPPLSLDKLRMVVVNSSDKTIGQKIPNVIDLLSQVCKEMKLKPTKAFEVANPPKSYKSGAYLLVGSGMWLNAPVLVSMYSLLMRIGFVHTKGNKWQTTIENVIANKLKPYQSSDSSQIASAYKGIKNILKNGYRKHFFIDSKKNYPENVDVGTMHGNSGIVAFSQGSTRQICKYWTRPNIGKAKVKTEELPANKDLAAGEVTTPVVISEEVAKAARKKRYEKLKAIHDEWETLKKEFES